MNATKIGRLFTGLIFILMGLLHSSATLEAAAVCEQHDFPPLPGYMYFYSDGRDFNFVAENTMTVLTIETESELAVTTWSSHGIIHIRSGSMEM